jgi:hypothetical protein
MRIRARFGLVLAALAILLPAGMARGQNYHEPFSDFYPYTSGGQYLDPLWNFEHAQFHGPIQQIEQVTYSPRAGIEVTTPTVFKFNDKGQLIERVRTIRSTAGGASKIVPDMDAVVSYDSGGRISKITLSEPPPSRAGVMQIQEATYDDAGNLTSISTRFPEGDGFRESDKFKFAARSTSEGGKMIAYGIADGPEPYKSDTRELVYDKAGHLIRYKFVPGYQNNPGGYVTPETLLAADATTKPVAEQQSRPYYTWNDKGDLAMLGSDADRVHYEFAYEYDTHGNWTSRTVTQIGTAGRGGEAPGVKEKVVHTITYYDNSTTKPAR